MITRETDYGIRAMMYLAVQPDYSVPVSSADLADTMGIPYRFLRKIVLKLIRANLVSSRRGKGGGLTIAVPPEEISLYQIMMAVDPNGISLNQCIEDESRCARSYFCGLHAALKEVQQVFDAKLQSIMLSSIAQADKERIRAKS